MLTGNELRPMSFLLLFFLFSAPILLRGRGSERLAVWVLGCQQGPTNYSDTIFSFKQDVLKTRVKIICIINSLFGYNQVSVLYCLYRKRSV